MSTEINPFILPMEQYVRKLDPIGQYIDQAAFYISVQTGKDLTTCRKQVIGIIKNKEKSGIKDPEVKYFIRGDNGDRTEETTTLTSYIYSSIKEDEIIAPTFTTYVPHKVKQSLLVDYVDDNVKARGVAKKEMFAAAARKETFLETIKNTEQTNVKLANNAVSGAHASKSTPLHNKTGHSTLTSICRSTSGNGNANNEKFLSGNRHYWAPHIVLNNIVSITTHVNYDLIQKVMKKYNLAAPTVEQVLKCITDSSDNYWRNKFELENIYDFVVKLNDYQRAAFVYVGDLYHLGSLNQDMMRVFLGRLSTKKTDVFENPIDYIKSSNEDNVNLAHQICGQEMKGKGKDYRAIQDVNVLNTVASTVKNIALVLDDYKDLIEAFWVTENFPASVAYFPDSVRKSVVTSDTDSTIFTVQEWVKWYVGDITFDEIGMSIAASVVFLASQTITHLLAMMSANLGVEHKRLKQIAMKNEFKFDVFVPCNVGKHYFALISCQEGNVFEKYKKEIKGVHLKSSNAPVKITKLANKLMEDTMNTIIAGKKIKILEVLKLIGDTEREIIRSMLAGENEYFRLAQIKPPGSYTNPDSSPYRHHLFWEEVFAPKYGSVIAPPYSCIKFSTTLENPSTTRAWIESIEDKALANRLNIWMTVNKRTILPTIYLSQEMVKSQGIPPELTKVIDIRRMVFDLAKVLYMVLETLGMYVMNSKQTKLVSDTY